MFRNFVKPAALERHDMREGQRAHEHAVNEVLYETDAEHNLSSDPKTANMSATAEISTNHNSHPPSVNSNGSLSKKGGYTTSIYVNNVPKRPPRAPTNRHSSHETSTNHSQSNGSLHRPTYSRPTSLPDGQLSSTRHDDPSIRQRLSDISIAEVKPNKTVGNDQSSSVIQIPAQPAHSTPANENFETSLANISENSVLPASHVANRNSEPVLLTGAETDAITRSNGVYRSNSFTQTRYNVIPPPPPLVEPVFAGRRDVRDPTSVRERQIVSAKGTVRGFKNRVRAGIATFWAQPEEKRNYRQLEQGKIVIYGTSMSVVRETYERCKVVRNMLQNHMVRYEERDLYMSREIQLELKHRLSQEGITEVRLPHVFADGIHLGGAEELEKMNEAGELRGVLDNYQKITVRIMCDKCGGYRFLPCEVCHGSKRSLLRNHFTEELCALRCMHCDENGLKRCDACTDQQE